MPGSGSVDALSVAVIAFWGTIGAAIFTVLGGLVGAIITNNRTKLRDRQDKESEWRSHAIELTKLDADRLIELRKADPNRKLRPLILEFLANYRNLQDLNTMSPADLYLKIKRDRIDPPPPAKPSVVTPGVVACAGESDDHPRVFLLVEAGKLVPCPYCGLEFTARIQPAKT